MQLAQFDSTRVQELMLSRNADWNHERFAAALQEYRRFLTLCRDHPTAKIMAPADVDEVWHAHMLDSVHYHRDCQQIFGGYLHHDPCIGERDVTNTQATLELYEQVFGEPPSLEWTKMLTCANPGGGCGSITAFSTAVH